MMQGSSFKQLRLEGVCQRFMAPDGHWVEALKDLNLEIKGGEFIALLGPSGCGKSTALNSLAGLIPLSGGSIHLDETRIDVLPPEQRGFGMVFQSYALFPHMSVLDNVGFGLKMRGSSKADIKKRALAALDLVQLSAHANKLPGQLSGGQQQRVAIARAIVIEPPLILMDEPLSNLDTKLRIEMRAEIRRIHRQLGRATIYVTHDQDEALSMADRIVVMKEGVMQQVGSPEEVYERPANLHVARFMGYRNVLSGRCVSSHGDALLTLDINGLQCQATSVQASAISAGQAIALALRPEDFEVLADKAPGSIAAVVDSMEYGGRESLLVLDTAVGKLYARMDGHYAIGQHLSVRVPPSKALVYLQEA